MDTVTTFRITGTSTLLCHNPAGMNTARVIGNKKAPAPQEEASRGVYTIGNYAGFPKQGFHASILAACKGRKAGKLSARTIFQGAMSVSEPDIEYVPLFHPKTNKPISVTGHVVDSRRAVVNGSGIIRSRPSYPAWACEVPFVINTELLELDEVLKMLNIAGQMIGVGDYRPDRKGWFGKFTAVLKA